jgi:hypothetical protein
MHYKYDSSTSKAMPHRRKLCFSKRISKEVVRLCTAARAGSVNNIPLEIGVT